MGASSITNIPMTSNVSVEWKEDFGLLQTGGMVESNKM